MCSSPKGVSRRGAVGDELSGQISWRRLRVQLGARRLRSPNVERNAASDQHLRLRSAVFNANSVLLRPHFGLVNARLQALLDVRVHGKQIERGDDGLDRSLRCEQLEEHLLP